MRISVKRRAAVGTVVLAAVGIAACGGGGSSSSSNGNGNGSSVSLAPTDFTSDFAVMKQLTDLAAKGKGKIGVLLPDTASSARYVAFDAPYLTQAFEAAGLAAAISRSTTPRAARPRSRPRPKPTSPKARASSCSTSSTPGAGPPSRRTPNSTACRSSTTTGS